MGPKNIKEEKNLRIKQFPYLIILTSHNPTIISRQIMENKLMNTHVKLLAFEFNTLTPLPSNSSLFSRTTSPTPLSRAETLGLITSRDYKPNKFLRFTIDDGTGCIPCILWLNHFNSPYFSRRDPTDVRHLAELADSLASVVEVGVVARVRGRISAFRGVVQITVTDVGVERDPNAEILHWLQCVKLARNCYDVLPCSRFLRKWNGWGLGEKGIANNLSTFFICSLCLGLIDLKEFYRSRVDDPTNFAINKGLIC
ncbi:CST complex subunit STN1 isoform X1 [Apium graveolens]|uniref:CST complex subunit STN1 isoform X1 n=1 Tax=Apium graveolens TaxID=4045 RepID=UPI003D7B5B56